MLSDRCYSSCEPHSWKVGIFVDQTKHCGCARRDLWLVRPTPETLSQSVNGGIVVDRSVINPSIAQVTHTSTQSYHSDGIKAQGEEISIGLEMVNCRSMKSQYHSLAHCEVGYCVVADISASHGILHSGMDQLGIWTHCNSELPFIQS